MPDRQPWDRRPNEPDTSFAGYLHYRDQPPGQRSTRRVAAALRRGHTIIDSYSSTHDWVARARAWDDHLAQQRAATAVAEAVDAASRQVEDGRRLQSMARVALENLIERDDAGHVVGVHGLTPRDMLALLQTGVRFEHDALADPRAAVEFDFVMRVVDAFASAFVEVNDLDTPAARLTAFTERCQAALVRLAPGEPDGGASAPD